MLSVRLAYPHSSWRKKRKKNDHLYITKSWSIAFNATTLTLHHISYHVILFFFFKYNFSYNFKMVFTIFSPINAAHYLFIYFHYHPIINPAYYLFIYFHYHPIINLYNQSSLPLIYLVPLSSPTQNLFSSVLGFCVSLFSLKEKKKTLKPFKLWGFFFFPIFL